MHTVAILAPLGKDAPAIARVVESCSLRAAPCATSEDFAEFLDGSASGEPCFAVISLEGADRRAGEALVAMLEREPAWSRLPVIFLVSNVHRLPPACTLLDAAGGSMARIVLERPVKPAILQRQFLAMAETRQRQLEVRDLMERLRESEDRQRFLFNELRHRMKNSLALLKSLFNMSARHAEELGSFLDSFSSRLQSFVDAHTALTDSVEEERDLEEILRTHVLPHCLSPDQLRIEGPSLRLPREFSFQLALVVHELAINAAKYGALSREDGIVRFTVERSAPDAGYVLTWQESGGPPVHEPERRGLGTTLISAFASGGAEAVSTFRPSGMHWQVTIPAGLVVDPGAARA